MVTRLVKLVFLLPLLGLAGCSTMAEKPDPYAMPEYAEPDKQCRDIAGRYKAVPHPVGELEETRPMLALSLLPDGPRLNESVAVELSLDEAGAMQVSAYGADGALLAKQVHLADSGIFECDEGQLRFFPQKLDPAAETAAWETTVMRKTVDGSLMLRKGGLFSGLAFMLMPMTLTTDDWYLFKPVE